MSNALETRLRRLEARTGLNDDLPEARKAELRAAVAAYLAGEPCPPGVDPELFATVRRLDETI